MGERELEEHMKTHTEERISFSGGVTTTYGYLSNRYGIIAFLLAIFSLAKWSERIFLYKESGLKVLSHLTSFSMLILLVFILEAMIRSKRVVEEWFYEFPQNTLARLSASYDWVLLVVVLILFVLQLFTLVSLFKSQNTRGTS